MTQVQHKSIQPFGENTYVISRAAATECLVVDPGFEPGRIWETIGSVLVDVLPRPVVAEGPGAIDAEHIGGLSAGIHSTMLNSRPDSLTGEEPISTMSPWRR